MFLLLSGVLCLTACTAGAEPSTTSQSGWHWGIDTVDLGNGYALGACDGDADQIACITRNESVVGTAERLSLPVATFDFLADTDDPMESLALIASDYMANVEVDREASCPDLGFKTIGPDPVTVASGPGLRFGFSQTRDQEVVEQNLIYGIRIGETVHLLNFSATADGSCVGVEGLSPRTLDQITPELDAAIAAVILDT